MRRLGHWNRRMVFRMVSRAALHNPQIGQHKGRLQMNTNTLLESDSHALLLIDHLYLPLLTLRSHEASQVISNATSVPKAAKVFKLSTLLTTAFAEGQDLFKEIQDVFPGQTPIDRTTLKTWEDQRILNWVKQTDRKKLINDRPERKSACRCPYFRPWRTGTKSISSPTRPAARAVKRTTWRFSA
jgi:hypothetical protein